MSHKAMLDILGFGSDRESKTEWIFQNFSENSIKIKKFESLGALVTSPPSSFCH